MSVHVWRPVPGSMTYVGIVVAVVVDSQNFYNETWATFNFDISA